MINIEEYYRENYKGMVKRARGRLNGNIHLAEEAVQSTFVKAMTYYHGFDPAVKSFDAWINTIMNNTIRDIRQTEMTRGIVKDEEASHTLEAVPIQDPYSNEITNKVDREIERISNKGHKYVCSLFFKMGIEPKAIKDLVEGESVSNISKILSRFRGQFVAKYGENGTLFGSSF